MSIEQAMKKHEWVPVCMIEKFSKMKNSLVSKIVKSLLKNKLLAHTNKKYDGYRVNYKGYDYLAILKLMKNGSITTVLNQIGVGKESDIYLCKNSENKFLVLKLERLGRVSFRKVKDKREYLSFQKHYNWLYLSKLASQREFYYMDALYQAKFPVPVPIDYNRHAIVMSFVNGFPLQKVKDLEKKDEVYNKLMDIIELFATNGLIHSDFNEFNIMIDNDYNLTIIDFPQMISFHHRDAKNYFDRDVRGVINIFKKRFNYFNDRIPEYEDIKVINNIDDEINAAGSLNLKNDKYKNLNEYFEEGIKENSKDEGEEDYDVEEGYDEEEDGNFNEEDNNEIDENNQEENNEENIKEENNGSDENNQEEDNEEEKENQNQEKKLKEKKLNEYVKHVKKKEKYKKEKNYFKTNKNKNKKNKVFEEFNF